VSAVEIYHKLRAVYAQTAMSEGPVRQWCRMLKDGRTNVHNEEQSGQPSVVSDGHVESVDQKLCKRQCFTISELLGDFPQISHTLLYEISLARLPQVLRKMGSESAQGCPQNS
jgi:hypothetical protein